MYLDVIVIVKLMILTKFLNKKRKNDLFSFLSLLKELL